MLNMENAEEVMQILERFTRLKQKEIPKELDDYMHYVAKTGDTVFKWSSLKYLFREKLLNVIKNFHDTSPRVDDLPQYPNVDPFNYESMKSSLLERLELFNAAPFSVQRLCELLTEPRKQYSRIDKFMRALEKNILVSTIEPGRKRSESENGDSLDSVVNGDASLDVNVDNDMENDTIFNADNQSNATSSSTPASQPSSNLVHKSDDDILPNPKKPKLDIDETTTPDAETEAATKSIICSKADSADSSAEKTIEETSEASEAKKSEEVAAEASTVSTDEAVTTTESEDIKKATKVPEPEKMDDETPSSTVENNNVNKTDGVSAEKADEKEEITSSESVNIEKVSAPEVCGDGIDSTDQTEKMDEEPEGKKKDCATEEGKTSEVDSKMNGKDIPEEAEAVADAKKIEEKTETTITTTSVEIPKDKQPDSAADEATAPSSGDKVKETVNDAAPVVAAAVVAEKPTDSSPETSKAEVDSSSVPEDAKKTEEAASAEKTPTPAPEEVQEEKVADSTEQIDKADTVTQAKPKTESPQNATAEASEEAQSTTTDTKKASEEAAETSTASPVEAETIETAVPVVVAEPTVPIDQPMEENSESIAEVEPVVPTIVVEAAVPVEEVVMGDSAEMATDTIEPAKDEPAGMEVDDTSQEAMDQ